MKLFVCTLAAAFAVAPAFAQRYEFLAGGGVSMYDSKTVTNPRGDASAGFKTGFGFTTAIGHNMYRYVGGEVRYSYQINEIKLESGSSEATFDAQSHAIHYDFLIHTAPTGSRVRPYVAFGGGVKQFRGTGAEVAFQPLSNVALLTKTDEIKGMASFGGGVKVALSERLLFRVDVHDYLTPFPKEVIAPNVGSKASGWFNNIFAIAGVSFTF